MAGASSSDEYPVGAMDDTSDEEDDADPTAHFIFKANVKKLAAPVVIEIPSSSDGSSMESGEEGATKKRRKRKMSKAPGPTLPAWTRSNSDKRSSKGRGSTEERKSREKSKSETRHLISSDEERKSGKGKGKGKGKEVPTERRRITITPPPAISAEERERIHRMLNSTAPITIDDEDDEWQYQQPNPLASSSSPNGTPLGSPEKIKVYVHMVFDKEEHPDASENAIRHWEKQRNVIIFKEGNLGDLWDRIAEYAGRSPEDIELVYEGRKIISRLTTPRQLRMTDGALISGYDKSHWDRMEKREKERKRRLIEGTPPLDLEGSPPPSTPAEVKKRIRLRGGWGEHKVAVASFVKGATLSEVYCTKCGKDKGAAKGLRLVFDGERVEPDTTMAELDIEDGDMIDVEV